MKKALFSWKLHSGKGEDSHQANTTTDKSAMKGCKQGEGTEMFRLTGRSEKVTDKGTFEQSP